MAVRNFAIALIVVLAGLLLAACGVDDNTAQTVNHAVSLLQSLESEGAWSVLTDSIAALEERPAYVASFTVRAGQVDATGAWLLPLDTDLTATLIADGAGNLLVEVSAADRPAVYLVAADAEGAASVYALEGDRAVCADRVSVWGLDRGLGGLLEHFGVASASAASLAVARAADADAAEQLHVAGRRADRYPIAARLPDALDILARTEQDALRQRVAQAGAQHLAGTLILDHDTGALLSFNGTVTQAGQRQTTITFAVTEWDAPHVDPRLETMPVQACD